MKGLLVLSLYMTGVRFGAGDILPLLLVIIVVVVSNTYFTWGWRGRDRMVVGFTTTYAISAYHH